MPLTQTLSPKRESWTRMVTVETTERSRYSLLNRFRSISFSSYTSSGM